MVANAPKRQTPRKRHRLRRAILPTLVVLVVLLVAARLALPWWLQRYVNDTIDRSPDYDGRVGEIDVHLLRGAYSINDLKIVKTTHRVPVPFFEGDRVDFSLDYEALWKQGALRGEITMIKPRLNFVDGETEEDDQTGAGQPWLAIIQDLYPFRIDSAKVVDGTVSFQAFHKEPNVDVNLTKVQAELKNLTNIENKTDPLMATLKASAEAMGGTFELDMSMDPSSYRPHLEVATRVLNVDVNQLNDLAQAYGEFDFEGGRFDLVIEFATRDGYIDGYLKPLFRNVQVISLKDAKEDNPLEFFWEALVGTVGELLTNQPRDQFGTRVTIEGDIEDPKTSVLEIIGNVLRNAFVRAYLPRIEGKVAPSTRNTEGDSE